MYYIWFILYNDLYNLYLKTPLDGFFGSHILWMKNTARNKQIVFFAKSKKNSKIEIFYKKKPKKATEGSS